MSISTLKAVQNVMDSYGYTVMLVLGSIGNIFVLMVFIRQHPTACSIYITGSTTANLLYVVLIYLLRVLLAANNNGSIISLLLCKFGSYIPGFFGQVAKTMLISACIDRYLITSNQAMMRALSTPKRAKYFVVFVYIFWMIGASHQAVFLTIVNGQCIRVGLYATFFTFYTILFVGWIPSIILSIFAYLTYRNMKHVRTRIQPSTQGAVRRNRIVQRRDRYLLVLVIAEVIVYIITTALFPAALSQIMISGYILPVKSFDHIRVEMFMFGVSLFLLYVYSAVPFYVYIIVSPAFRHDFRQLIVVAYGKIRRQPHHQPIVQLIRPTMRVEIRV